MKTSVIYEPKGKAREYSPLAFNLFTGCPHRCKYCYAPQALHMDREAFHANVEPRKDILARLEKDCSILRESGETRQILLCFTCDPYPARRPDLWKVTRAALDILEKHKLSVAILTKGGLVAFQDFDIMARNGWSFGTTLTAFKECETHEVEPVAPGPLSRVKAIILAKRAKIHTFVSLEPVIKPADAIAFINAFKRHVDLWKIGPLNYNKEAIAGVDWDAFVAEVKKELPDPRSYYLKEDLLAKLTKTEGGG